MAAIGPGDATDELVQVAHLPGNYVAGRFRNVAVFYWVSAGTAPAVDALNQLCEELSAGRKVAFSAIHVVRADVGLPSAGVRQLLSASMKRFADVTCCLGIVTLGAGFWLSALQSAVTGIRMVAPVGNSMLRFVQKPEGLKGWFVDEHRERTDHLLDEVRLIEAVYQTLSIGDRAQLGSSAR